MRDKEENFVPMNVRERWEHELRHEQQLSKLNIGKLLFASRVCQMFPLTSIVFR